MSLKSMFQKINSGKILGYGVAVSGSIPAALDIFRMASGDISASASFAQNFSIIAAGLGIVQAAKTQQPASEQQTPAPIRAHLIMPRPNVMRI